MPAPLTDITCPRCGGKKNGKHGRNASGNQQYRCSSCGRIHVREPHIPEQIRTIADRMLQQDITVRVAGTILHGYVSRRWLYKRRESLHGRD
jgi:DNA-directed RNA polymerase subunit RPC12/RpoP